MSKEYSFAVMPSVSISRSRFARKSQHKTTFNLGEIVPIYMDEVLPGDTRSIDMAALVRMSTPIAPIMDNIYLDLYAFFVPARLTWIHWKEFMGENSVSAGIPSTNYSIPYVADNDGGGHTIQVGSLGDYFGLPVDHAFMYGSNTNGSKVSALPFRGYFLIYNRWFRNQNVIAPVAVQTGDTNEVIVGELGDNDFCPSVTGTSYLKKAAKFADYFTSSLPYAQKGTPVSIPLGTTAPIITGSLHSLKGDMKFLTGSGSTGNAGYLGTSSAGIVSADVNTMGVNSSVVTRTNLVADLSGATAATINQLRYAFQLQKLLEKDALYGSRYWEILNAHFGIQAPDASLQDPEYLGGHRININIDQVLQTTGYNSTPSNNDLARPGANSVTGDKSSLFTKSFVEHGYLYVLAVARHDTTYSQGINRMWTRQGRYDFYFPVFANLGAQAVLNKEIYAQGSSVDNQVFGYQEAWAEYRFKPSIASGLLNPNASSSLDYWTLSEKFGTKPTLGQTFMEQSRDNIKRALVTGSSGPDFIADFYFQDVAVRPMPMYSIPGLIDHH